VASWPGADPTVSPSGGSLAGVSIMNCCLRVVVTRYATVGAVQITARVALTAVPGGEAIWENPAFTFRGNYEFNATAATYVDRENDAIDRVADQFAQSLVTSMLEGF